MTVDRFLCPFSVVVTAGLLSQRLNERHEELLLDEVLLMEDGLSGEESTCDDERGENDFLIVRGVKPGLLLLKKLIFSGSRGGMRPALLPFSGTLRDTTCPSGEEGGGTETILCNPRGELLSHLLGCGVLVACETRRLVLCLLKADFLGKRHTLTAGALCVKDVLGRMWLSGTIDTVSTHWRILCTAVGNMICIATRFFHSQLFGARVV